MAGRIDTDPAALVAMARELKNASASIDGSVRKVRSALNSSQWNDNVRKDFEKNLEAIARMAKQIEQVSDESQRMLNRKAQQLQQYLGR
ncbi:WXG100 family type VII secretion target [Mycolicibacterium arenosum]|uniref:WXG100 family type VII secretion target n=1 Tax=Mycolicibacterium arenosum TaxID=2952157 RepID=A0ABT1M494_9MYCO|nr:WXG100 family type VII secretion target [Mycolicibacterium sp. CAU 1645]MCP9273936.1 WXG100 family type VII secretion target [Mycolicibacterium sp. CAU 1645]